MPKSLEMEQSKETEWKCPKCNYVYVALNAEEVRHKHQSRYVRMKKLPHRVDSPG